MSVGTVYLDVCTKQPSDLVTDSVMTASSHCAFLTKVSEKGPSDAPDRVDRPREPREEAS